MVNKVRTIDFLPEVFQTYTNRQFLDATLDILSSQPNLRRVEGFIGEKYGYGVEPNDTYVVEPSEQRTNYQLDPGVVFLKPETQIAQDFISYPGIINSLKINNGNVSNHDRLFNNDFYCWDPFVDYDKIINYSRYYWIPNGPDAVPVTTNIVYNTNSYTVISDDNGYQLTGLDTINSEITMLRGGTYTFVVPAQTPPLSAFWIQKVVGVNADLSARSVLGVTNNGTNNGTVTFTVPNKAALINDILYYQSGTDPNSVGQIKLVESNAANYINVNDIIGKKNYISPNGVQFTNGLKIQFQSATVPSSYQNKSYYVEGVGTSIKLIPVEILVATELSSEAIYNPWDASPWDTSTWDLQLNVPVRPDYITINRNSFDLNAWSRSNRWFHQDVLDVTEQFLGYVTSDVKNQPSRGQRPIIEFRGNLKLYNHGSYGLGLVDIFDTNITDALSQVQGKTPTQVGTLDSIGIIDGIKIIFANDANYVVRKNIYTVKLEPIGPGGVNIINLIPDITVTVQDDAQVFVATGGTQRGTSWRFTSDGNIWVSAQRKTEVNQYPLYDIFNSNGQSFSNSVFYNGSTFRGTKLFSFALGSGPNDSVLGFPLQYSLPVVLGDVIFSVDFNSDTFSYSTPDAELSGQNINSGFVHSYYEPFQYEKLTGWVPAVGQSFQYQVFEFPVSTTTITQFKLDVPAKTNTPYANVVVYLDDRVLNKGEYTYVINGTTSTIVSVTSEPGTKVTILVISDYTSQTAYYQTPFNLENNPFNENITSVAVGDIRNQYESIFLNAPNVVGRAYGNNNIHDLGNLNNYGTTIIQNSASLVLPGVFLRKQNTNPFDAIQFNSEQYSQYKTLIMKLVETSDYSIFDTPSIILDDIIYNISKTKTNTDAFFWSDMIFSGNPYVTNTYNINANASTVSFSLSDIWSPTLFEKANYYGVGVYLTRIINNLQTEFQLLKDVNYTVGTSAPTLTINYPLLIGDKITVKEYNQTYGSFCPSTPTKLGLYPLFVPGPVKTVTGNNVVYYIKGHDGSLTKCFGTYNETNKTYSDFRDAVLLEFENRVYNNYKVNTTMPLTVDDVIPGQFRTTEYTHDEIQKMYSVYFLNWVGVNRLDYRTQTYNSTNKFSYNYNNSSNKLNGSQILQGYWRGIYKYFYDTDNPAVAPWEMLGLVNKPSWWDSRYGLAPYTSGNTFMWDEIASGFIWNNGNSYIDQNRVRPQLLSVLPVDSYGNLISPFESIVSNYNNLTFQRDWVVGDGAPVEANYQTSSTYPFDLMKLLALTKPAKFFNLFVDMDEYVYNTEFDQYLFQGRYHLNPKLLSVFGDGTAKHSYINWIVEYINQYGINGTEVVNTYLKNLDVRLCYNLAGFSGKNYLKFLVEKATPNSKNTSLLIPDENYAVLLYDNPPQEIIYYSSVIIQKTNDGWQVYGNSKNRQYFTVQDPKPGFSDTLVTLSESITVSTTFYDTTTIVSYGTKFYSVQALCQFLISYGAYLEKQGVQNNNIVEGVPLNWQRSAQEFIAWTQQGWQNGSIISLNPNADNFTVSKNGLVVQSLTSGNNNFVLNQNLLPIQSQDMCVKRQNTEFNLEMLNASDTLAYTNLNLSAIEHAVVFDNSTSFGDVIYNLITGLRQPRLLLQGYKTSEWNGYIDANGFILNQDNVQEWQQNKKYPKNIIVTYKNNYYTAKKLIEPTLEFSEQDWLLTDYDKIRSGLLPNPSTIASESQYYYDINRANLENDVDLLSFSLIGFRPRDYMSDADLSDISQINIYKNIIKQKGTNLVAEGFKNAQFDQGAIDYTIQENWSIKTGEFGGVLNNNFVECLLDKNLLTGNPSILGFGTNVAGAQQSVPMNQLINFERPPINNNFLPVYEPTVSNITKIPSAGFVNLEDVRFSEYNFEDLNDDPDNVNQLLAFDNVWIANYNGTWGIFMAAPTNTQIIQVNNNLNGTVNVVFADFHNLSENDLITIIKYDSKINGFYKVKSIVDLLTITITLDLGGTVTGITSVGTAFKLVHVRTEQPSDAEKIRFENHWGKRKIWADHDRDNNWAVYQAYPVFSSKNIFLQNKKFGISVAYSTFFGKLVADGIGNLYRVFDDGTSAIYTGGIGDKSKVVIANNFAYCSSPTEKRIYIYTLSTTGVFAVVDSIDVSVDLLDFTGAIAVSQDRYYLYAADSTNQKIALYFLNSAGNYQFMNLFYDPLVLPNYKWGESIAISNDGYKLVVGAPNAVVNTLINAGSVYIYNKRFQKFYCNGVVDTFTLFEIAPNNLGQVWIDGVLQTANFNIFNDSLSFNIAPANGSIVTISTGYIEFAQKITSPVPQTNALFGHSVDTNRYGADVIIGCPYEIKTVDNNPSVEGGVYRYTNSGQRYGILKGQVVGLQTGSLLIDGYLVNYNGAISQIVDDINSQTPTNIVASYSGDMLTITVKEDTPEVPYNILTITGPYDKIRNLGITPYHQTQTINNFNYANVSAFGYTVKMDERDGLLVSAITDTKHSPTTFDFTDNCLDDDTIFDNGATYFVDNFTSQGNVYNYTYLPASNESIENPGKYVFGQYISRSTNTTDPQPKFGYSLAFKDNTIVVGSPDWSSSFGGIAMYTIDYTRGSECINLAPTSWFVDKKPVTVVDINSLQNISLYNTATNQTLEHLDFIDPAQGKILGVLVKNLDILSYSNPAIYDQTGTLWGVDQVGTTWLDLNTIRLLNYNQPDLTYNAKNWGKAFPGSTADVYTWVESLEKPINYKGPGFPIDFENYTSSLVVNKGSNSLVTKYYFWVGNYDQIPKGKNLSPLVVSQYLLNPLSSGIAFLAPLTTNIVSLSNCNDSILSSGTALHLGYGIQGGKDNKHTNWSLIREGNDADFLPGVPSLLGEDPSGLYLKLLESFSGRDINNNQVPDFRLPELTRYGTSFRPRQSMFINRLTALETFIVYANNILRQFPIVEIRDLTYIQQVTPSYDVRTYWSYINYWAPGFDDNTKAIIEVNNFNDLQTILPQELIVSVSGVNIFLEDGLIAKVHANPNARAEFYVYRSATSSWERIGVEQGTIQINELIYNQFGWSSEPWGDIWDKTPSDEIYWIVRWLIEQCYTDELILNRNKSLILMFKYIQSESLQQNNYLTWLNKTSLIDVKHKIRSLLPYKKFQRDNQEFLAGYLNEIKPFHVKIKDFVFSYDGLDPYTGDITDFDLPAEYNSTSGEFVTPQLVYATSFDENQFTENSPIWQAQQYNQWFNNYGLSINNTEQDTVPITQLELPLTTTSTNAVIKSAYGLPTVGTVTIGTEQISYNSVDYITNTLVGLVRGYDNTVASAHDANSIVFCKLPQIVVLDRGRKYTEPPKIEVYIDTSLYPEPREEALLQPIMAGDSLIGVTVINPGSGYAVKPEIIIQSSETKQFNSTAFNITNNTINIPAHGFVNGDSVIYSTGASTTAPLGLNVNQYYYVRVMNVNTIALYEDFRSASVLNNKTASADSRVKFITQGSGVNQKLSLTARAICLTSGLPIRELNVNLRFNRTSYSSSITTWESGTYYISGTSLVTYNNLLYRCIETNNSSTFNAAQWQRIYKNDSSLTAADAIELYYNPTSTMPGKDLSLLMEGVTYPNDTLLEPVFNLGWDGGPYDDLSVGWDSPDSDPEVEYEIISPAFSPDPPVVNYEVSGGEFPDGYGPEELIAGVVTDTLNITVKSNYTVSPGVDAPINFRISMLNPQYSAVTLGQTVAQGTVVTGLPGSDTITLQNLTTILTNPSATKGYVRIGYEIIYFTSVNTVNKTISGLSRGLFGTPISDVILNGTIVVGIDVIENGEVYNVNPYTQATLIGTFTTSSDPYNDVIYVNDVTKLLENSTDTSGFIFVQGEYIQFFSVNLANNSITKLTRGMNGSITNATIDAGSIIQSVMLRDRLQPVYYNQWWYNIVSGNFINGTLFQSSHPAAVFLKQTTP